MRIEPEGGEPELFAWGFRNPIGLAVHQDGRVFCTDRGMENRGSRPIAGGRGYLWRVQEGGWYGWPDYEGALPVTEAHYKPENGPQPDFVIKNHPSLSARPIASFPLEAGISKFDFSRSPFFGNSDYAFIALMGDAGNSQEGFKVVKVSIRTGTAEDFATNPHPGPASSHRSGGLERPVAVKFDRTGEIMYVLDMGIAVPDSSGSIKTLPNTGVLWRIRPEEVAA
jgi:glucose/arabinose dehydrogenase